MPVVRSSNNSTSSSTHKPQSAKTKRDDGPRRSPNAFILFRQNFCRNFYQPGSFKKTHDGPSLSGIISDHWHELSSDDQRYWYQKADERIPPRKINKPKKLPRAPNCFILFRRHYVHNIHQRGSLSPTGPRLSKIIGELWKRLPPDEKNIWKRKAKDEAERSKLSELQFGYQDRDHAKDSSSDKTRGHNTSSNDCNHQSAKAHRRMHDRIENNKAGPSSYIHSFQSHPLLSDAHRLAQTHMSHPFLSLASRSDDDDVVAYCEHSFYSSHHTTRLGSSSQPMRTSQIPRLLPQEVQSYNSMASLPTVAPAQDNSANIRFSSIHDRNIDTHPGSPNRHEYVARGLGSCVDVSHSLDSLRAPRSSNYQLMDSLDSDSLSLQMLGSATIHGYANNSGFSLADVDPEDGMQSHAEPFDLVFEDLFNDVMSRLGIHALPTTSSYPSTVPSILGALHDEDPQYR
ncbi:hypothetical protein FB446DRAFT_827922 [Lentinula raphanica]|nr:hypothetical protein FB446DRAFT_827922 [Lentinula raphanica]